MQPKKLVYLEWCDAITNNASWLSPEQAIEWADNEDWVIKQVGWILKENKEYILVASRLNPHSNTEKTENVDGIIKIPKTWIRKRKNLVI